MPIETQPEEKQEEEKTLGRETQVQKELYQTSSHSSTVIQIQIAEWGMGNGKGHATCEMDILERKKRKKETSMTVVYYSPAAQTP